MLEEKLSGSLESCHGQSSEARESGVLSLALPAVLNALLMGRSRLSLISPLPRHGPCFGGLQPRARGCERMPIETASPKRVEQGSGVRQPQNSLAVASFNNRGGMTCFGEPLHWLYSAACWRPARRWPKIKGTPFGPIAAVTLAAASVKQETSTPIGREFSLMRVAPFTELTGLWAVSATFPITQIP